MMWGSLKFENKTAMELDGLWRDFNFGDFLNLKSMEGTKEVGFTKMKIRKVRDKRIYSFNELE